MFRSFFKLNRFPFQTGIKPGFIWPGKSLKKVLITLRNDLLNKSGISILTGDLGTGKSTIASILAYNLAKQSYVGVVIDPGGDELELLNAIAHAFQLPSNFKSRDSFHRHFERYLATTDAEGKNALLIVDEAQDLNSAKLDVIASLANMKVRSSRVLRVLLIGHTSMVGHIARSKNSELKALLASRHTIRPLTAVESADYIRSRMKFAGASRQIFTADTILAIHNYSRGILRQINTLADNALFETYIAKSQEVTPEVITKIAHKFDLAQAQSDREHEEPDQADKRIHFTVSPKYLRVGLAVGICLAGAIIFYSVNLKSNRSLIVATTNSKSKYSELSSSTGTSDSELLYKAQEDSARQPAIAQSGEYGAQAERANSRSEVVSPAIAGDKQLPSTTSGNDTVIASSKKKDNTNSYKAATQNATLADSEIDYQAYTKAPPKQKDKKAPHSKNEVDDDPEAIIDWYIEHNSD